MYKNGNMFLYAGDYMTDITFNDFEKAEFSFYNNNPVLKYPKNSMVVADPSILTPDKTPDKKWHLFAHTFFGVHHYTSNDGISFKHIEKITGRAMRPNINIVNGEFVLYYERTRVPILNALSTIGIEWRSEIYCVTSPDLKNWSKPRAVITQSRPFEKDSHGTAISNPFLIEKDGKYRLYYSCGQTFIKDCGFCEPTHISFAESKRAKDGYVSRQSPIISPDKNSKYLNLCSGCLKVYRLKDCYIGLQNGLYEENGKSHSAIMLLKSDDGEHFEFVKPMIVPEKKHRWMAQFVYACCLTYYDGKLRIYFNARNAADIIRGRESIGFAEASL